MTKNCTNCRHAATRPEGYSEYTLEGTSFHCLERANPDIGQYGISWESYEPHDGEPYSFAVDCPSYQHGKINEFDFGDELPFKEAPREYDDYR